MSRRGFTLTELLVATIVFMIGFVSVFALFLGGMRMRKLAEDTTRSSLAASCLIDEIRIDAGGGGGGIAMAPNQYEGDGFAPFSATSNSSNSSNNGNPVVLEGELSDATSIPPSNPLSNPLFPYRPIPGTWYRVLKCTDLNNNSSNAQTTVLKLDLLVVPFSTADSKLTFDELNRRLSLIGKDDPASPSVDLISTRLVQRGLGFRFVAVVTRRPSWLP